MSYFSDLKANELLSSFANSSTLECLYSEGLKTSNPLLAISAQNELAKRGEFAKIKELLNEYLLRSHVSVDDPFIHVLGESLSEYSLIDPVIDEVSSNILDGSKEVSEVTEVSLSTSEKETFVNTLRELMDKHYYDDVQFYALAESVFENKIN